LKCKVNKKLLNTNYSFKKFIFEAMNPAENYILQQKEPLQSIMLFVRQVIIETVPTIEEKYKYKIPFYYYLKYARVFVAKSQNVR